MDGGLLQKPDARVPGLPGTRGYVQSVPAGHDFRTWPDPSQGDNLVLRRAREVRAMEHGDRGGNGHAGQMLWMMGLMMAMCMALPLTVILMSAIGAPAVVTVAAVAAALGLCLFGHRLMKH